MVPSRRLFRQRGRQRYGHVRDLGEEPALERLIGGVKTMLDAYTEGRIDALYLAGNEFVNTMTQSPQVEQFCP